MKLAAKLLVTAGLLWLVAANADLPAMRAALSRIDAATLVAAWVALFALTALQAVRWRLIAAALGFELPFRRSWRYVLLGSFFSQVLPTSIGGDVVRIWKLHRDGTPLRPAASSVVLDRVVALVATLLIALAGAPLLLELFPAPGARAALAAFLAAALLGLVLLLAATCSPALRALVARLPAFARAIVEDSARVIVPSRIAAALQALSLASQAVIGAVVWLLVRDAGGEVGVLVCIVVVPVVMLIAMLPVSIAGWGVREGAMLVGLGAAGIAPGIAVTASLVFGALLAASSLPAVPAWLAERRLPAPPVS